MEKSESMAKAAVAKASTACNESPEALSALYDVSLHGCFKP
jgi:hypothetical protein